MSGDQSVGVLRLQMQVKAWGRMCHSGCITPKCIQVAGSFLVMDL